LRSSRLGEGAVLAAALALVLAGPGRAQEKAYFITYDHHMEEPGALEIALNPVFATQRAGGNFLAGWLEIEYGVKAWWTTELYVDGQATAGDSTVGTGLRWENRVRLLMHEHWINPVLYLELEDIDGADKTMLEVVGHDVAADHAVPNGLAHREHQREAELKLILSSGAGAWNVAENLIAEKNLAGAPWEFGYAVGASRPLALAARPEACAFCPENFTAGVEVYGGLGVLHDFGLRDTSHYLGALLALSLPAGATFKLSPGWGLNASSHRFVLRFGAAYELSSFAEWWRQAFGGQPR
jgi:hypothetical protein